MSIATNAVAVTDKYIDIEYHLFEGESVQNDTPFMSGRTKGLPQQTLKVIEEAAQGALARMLEDGDPRATEARISLYGVWTCVNSPKR